MSLKEKKSQLAKLSTDAKGLYAEMEKDETKRTPDNREKFDKYIEDGKSLRAEIDQLEVLEEFDRFTNQPNTENSKNHNPGGDALPRGERKTMGALVVGSDQFKNANRSRGEMDNVAVGSLITGMANAGKKGLYNTADAQGGFAVRADREAEIIDVARQRPFTILDLINVGQTSVDAVEYILFNSRTNNAAVVPEWDSGKTAGAGDFSNKFGDKPQGDLTLDLKTAIVKTIAEWIPASRQILSDAPNLRSMIDNELVYQIEYVLENQIVSGNGSGNNFTGILNTSGIQSRVHATSGRDFDADDSIGDSLRRAITDIALEFYEADGIILNPIQSEAMELERGSDGHYVNIYDPVAMRVWRKPVRESQATPDGTAIVGAFKIGTKLWDREQSNIRVGEPGNFFLQNAVAILAELRAAFAVTRPKAIEKVSGLNP
jgi:HK97 family phage major capsid protein